MRSSVTFSRRQCVAALLPLAAPAFVRHARAEDLPRFALGVASGLPQPERVVLWTRLTGDGLPERVDVGWEIADDEGFTTIVARGRETAEAAWAHSVHAEPAGLAPGRWYWYRFSALGQRSDAGRTRTAPAADALSPLRFAIASCQRWDHGRYAAWRHVAADAPDLVLFLGDYIYEYPSPPNALRRHEGGKLRTLEQYRARYAQYKSDPALQAAHAACPWLVTLDDHEVENDHARDHSPTLAGVPFSQLRAAAYQAAWEHQPWPQAWRPQGAAMRIHTRCDWGRLARFHLLDGRQYRDAQACLKPGRTGGAGMVDAADCTALHDPQRSLLGAAQERWLAEGWDPARPWNLLAQQTLMARASMRALAPAANAANSGSIAAPASGLVSGAQASGSVAGAQARGAVAGAPASGAVAGAWSAAASAAETGRYRTDGWDGYAASRARVLQALADRRVPNAVVLGGDIHAHAVADLHIDFDRPGERPVATEFVGTSISSRGPSAAYANAVRQHNPHIRHFRAEQRGSIGFTLDAKRLEARLWAIDRPDDELSTRSLQAAFTVEAGRSGAQAG
jgi:alkaline phosphatase D